MRLTSVLCLLVLVLFNCSPTGNPEPVEARTSLMVYLIGDSTVANKRPEVYPETGWGQVIGEYLDSLITIDNQAINGASTKSFMTGNKWSPVLGRLKQGDYVFIEFGHNDEKSSTVGYRTTIEEYKQYLVRYVNEARSKKAIPILLTPIARRSFEKGEYVETHGEYPAAMISVANDLNVPLIDMHSKSIDLLNKLGVEESKKIFNWVDAGKYAYYPNGQRDNTHFSLYGAQVMAKMVLDGIVELKLPIAKYIEPI